MYAIYARQSVDKKDSLSIEGQIEQCKKYAGKDVVVFRDKGFSGKNTKRPAFQELMDAVESGKVKKIYVYRLDRFSRSIADFSRIWEMLEKNDVEFQSVTEQFDTSTPMGRAMLNIVITFAQLERETTADRVRDNYMHRFISGVWPGGPAPYGFRLEKVVTDSGNKMSTLVVDSEKSEVVKSIFEMYAQDGVSLRKVARQLSEEGIPGPKRESWDNVTLSRILHSPVYVKADEDVYWHYMAMGLSIQNDIEDFDGVHACNVIGKRDRTKCKYNDLEDQKLSISNHLGFVESKLWLKVQDKLSNNKQISLSNAGKYSWLTGLMKCGKCGYSLKINNSKADHRLYLICSGKSNLKICDARIGVDLRELEAAVEKELVRVIGECTCEEESCVTTENAEIILEIEKKIERLVNALAECSSISVSYISKEIDRLHKERDLIVNSNSGKGSKITNIDFINMTFEEKKFVAAQFIDRILIIGDSVEIVWKI